MKRSPIAVFILLAGAALAAKASAGTLYATDIDTDNLYTIDTSTGQATLVGSLNQDDSFSGMAWDTGNSTLYISDITLPSGVERSPGVPGNAAASEPQGSSWGLASVDKSTGNATIIGSHVITNDVLGLAFDTRRGLVYGADGDNSSLDTINTATGEATILGSYATKLSGQVVGIVYDAANDTIWGVTADDSNGSSQLVQISPTTGALTSVGSLGVEIDPSDWRGDIALDPGTGTLFVAGNTGTLYTVDRNTGAATAVGSTGLDVDALVFVGPSIPLEAIPAVSPLGLAALTLLVLSAAFFALRRQRAA